MEKRAPELLAKWRDAVGQVERLLKGLGAMSQFPKCCGQAHFHMVVRGPSGCACHQARQWLESHVSL